jgi:hypothetical protein
VTGAKLPDSYLVMAGWLQAQLGLDGTRVGQILPPRTVPDPSDPSGQATLPAPWITGGGFLMLTSVSALAHPDELEIFQDVFQVDAYAAVAGSVKPPYGLASELAQRGYAATKQRSGCGVFPPLPAAYQRAQVRTVNGVTRPRRFPDADATGLARFQFELMINWTLFP